MFPHTMPPLMPSKLRGSKSLESRCGSWFCSHSENLWTNLGVVKQDRVRRVCV